MEEAIVELRKHLITVRGAYVTPLLEVSHGGSKPLQYDLIETSYAAAKQALDQLKKDAVSNVHLLEQDLQDVHGTVVSQYIAAAKKDIQQYVMKCKDEKLNNDEFLVKVLDHVKQEMDWKLTWAEVNVSMDLKGFILPLLNAEIVATSNVKDVVMEDKNNVSQDCDEEGELVDDDGVGNGALVESQEEDGNDDEAMDEVEKGNSAATEDDCDGDQVVEGDIDVVEENQKESSALEVVEEAEQKSDVVTESSPSPEIQESNKALIEGKKQLPTESNAKEPKDSKIQESNENKVTETTEKKATEITKDKSKEVDKKDSTNAMKKNLPAKRVFGGVNLKRKLLAEKKLAAQKKASTLTKPRGNSQPRGNLNAKGRRKLGGRGGGNSGDGKND